MNFTISKRLQTIADLVTPGNSVADIGTDHGYIPVYLAKNGISEKILAMDVNKGPLLKAEENIKAHNVSDKVDLRLSDGFEALNEGETDTVIIAGMGALLMNRILADGINKAHSTKEMILCPHCDEWRVRKFLWENGFCIVDEKMVKEDNKYYFILKVKNGADAEPVGEYLYYGRPLLAKRDAILQEYLKKELKLCHVIKENIMSNRVHENGERLAEITYKEECIKRGLDMYDGR